MMTNTEQFLTTAIFLFLVAFLLLSMGIAIFLVFFIAKFFFCGYVNTIAYSYKKARTLSPPTMLGTRYYSHEISWRNNL